MQTQCKEELAINVLPGKQLHGRAGVLLWKNDLDVFLKNCIAHSTRLETQTHTRNACASRIQYVHAQCMPIWIPGSQVPVSWVPSSLVPGSTKYSIPKLHVCGVHLKKTYSGQNVKFCISVKNFAIYLLLTIVLIVELSKLDVVQPLLLPVQFCQYYTVCQ